MSIVKLVFLASMLSCHQAGDCVQTPSFELPPIQERGLASYYGDPKKHNDGGMHGSITATQERFRPEKQHCASRTIPLNTIVLIEDVKTGNRAWCRVNDRGPYGADLYSGGWGIKMYLGEGRYLVRKRSPDGGWGVKEIYTENPGQWRGVMDLTYGTAKALDFDFRAGLNPIRIRYWNTKRSPRLSDLRTQLPN